MVANNPRGNLSKSNKVGPWFQLGVYVSYGPERSSVLEDVVGRMGFFT